MEQSEQEGRRVQTKLSPDLYKKFWHMLIDTGWHADEALRKLVELWIKGDIVLPKAPVRPKRKKKT